MTSKFGEKVFSVRGSFSPVGSRGMAPATASENGIVRPYCILGWIPFKQIYEQIPCNNLVRCVYQHIGNLSQHEERSINNS